MDDVTEQTLTELATGRWSDIEDPRLRRVMSAAVRHLHAFVREVEPTPEESFAGIEYLTRTGKMCAGNRQEFVLLSDVLGVSMLIDAITNRLSIEATPSTVEGPFHIQGSPDRAAGDAVTDGAPGAPCFVIGSVKGTDGAPVAGAMLDIWQTDGEGIYEAMRADAKGPWMRGIYRADTEGGYLVRTVLPLGYTIPMDGTVVS